MNKTCTFEQAKRLKELGVEQKANSTWTSENNYRYPFGYGYLYGPNDYAAFDTDELLAMMPEGYALVTQSLENGVPIYDVQNRQNVNSTCRNLRPAVTLAEFIIAANEYGEEGFSVAEINERIKQYNAR